MPDLFPCERKGCGHPLNRHDPCNGVVGAGKKAHPCECQAYQPADRKATVARLTDVELLPPDELARREAEARASLGRES